MKKIVLIVGITFLALLTTLPINAGFTNCSVETNNAPNELLSVKTDGIDVSHWQGSIDWQQVYNAGYRFAFCKATEGRTYIDTTFTTNMNNGCAAGMLMGGYHFARPDLGNSAYDEAQHFVSVIRPYLNHSYLRPVLDLERGSALGKAALSAWVHEFMNTVKNETGVEPIIYVNSNYANNYLETSVAVYNLWIAHWTYDPSATPNTGIWSNWDFWQYSDSGSVPGISGAVDLDLFNGNIVELQTFLITTVPTAPQNLRATAGDTQITLTWDPPASDGGSPITNYRIYRGTSSGATNFLTEIGNVTTYTDTNVVNGQTYYYNVTAVNRVGESPSSNEASATPQPLPEISAIIFPIAVAILFLIRSKSRRWAKSQ